MPGLSGARIRWHNRSNRIYGWRWRSFALRIELPTLAGLTHRLRHGFGDGNVMIHTDVPPLRVKRRDIDVALGSPGTELDQTIKDAIRERAASATGLEAKV